jgi:hypothetical protein
MSSRSACFRRVLTALLSNFPLPATAKCTVRDPLTWAARTVTPCEEAHPGPFNRSQSLQPRMLVPILVWTRHASRGHSKTELALGHREGFLPLACRC